MDYTLETPNKAQAKQICAIWEAGWHEAHANIVPASLRELRTYSSFFNRTVANLANTRIATDGAEVLGFCMVKENELYQMYVSRLARGTGIAQALIADAEERIRLAGHKTAWLACAMGNERAGRFYEKSGWNNTGPRIVDLDTSNGTFPLEVSRFEKVLDSSKVG